MKENKLKEKLINGHSVIGPFCKISSTSLVEISALAGFDFVILDMEHGPLSIESIQNFFDLFFKLITFWICFNELFFISMNSSMCLQIV